MIASLTANEAYIHTLLCFAFQRPRPMLAPELLCLQAQGLPPPDGPADHPRSMELRWTQTRWRGS